MNAKDVRKVWRMPKQRQECFVCGKYKPITEAHHLIPASYIAYLFRDLSVTNLYVYSIKTKINLEIPYIWLCPNHHTIWHLTTNRSGGLKNDFIDILFKAEFPEDDAPLVARAFDKLGVEEHLERLVLLSFRIEEWLEEKGWEK